jgi:hypothetical protein
MIRLTSNISNFCQDLSMRININFFRLLAIPACMLMGLTELVRLQRSRLLLRR